MADIFLSYAREDKVKARKLVMALEAKGWSIFWDPHIPLGREFHEVIQEELESASCVIVLWSKKSVGKKWVRSEASTADEAEKLLPARLEDIKPPMPFNIIQSADLIRWGGSEKHSGFKMLLREIDRYTNPAPGEDAKSSANEVTVELTKAKQAKRTKPEKSTSLPRSPDAHRRAKTAKLVHSWKKASTASKELQLLFGPVRLGAPDDLEKAIVDFIDGANERLSIAFQELDARSVADAIIRASIRGVAINLVLDGDYLGGGLRVADPRAPSGLGEENRQVFSALQRARVPIRVEYDSPLPRQKTITRDWNSSTGAAVLLLSGNLTNMALNSNFNHALILCGRQIADVFAINFNGLLRGYQKIHNAKPLTCDVSGVPVKTVFGSEHSPEREVMRQVLRGKKRVDFSMYTLVTSSGIDDAMIAAARSGLLVQGIMNRSQANKVWINTRPIKEVTQLFMLVPRFDRVKLHHKLMVVDREVVILGSFNYSGSLAKFENENLIIIGDLTMVKSRTKQRQRHIGETAVGEIQRIIRTASLRA